MHKNIVDAIGIVGKNSTPSDFNKINLERIDDQGVDQSHIIDGVQHVPLSPVKLLGVTTFGT